MSWHGYAIVTVTKALTTANKRKALVELRKLGRQTDRLPQFITTMRASVDGQKLLIEMTVPGAPTRATFADRLVAALGLQDAEVQAQIAVGDNWEARRQWIVAQIAADMATWGEDSK